MNLQSLNDVLVHELQDLHSAEQQLIEALPKMAGAATNDKLRTAFNDHLGETRHHLERIEDVCSQIGISPSGQRCKGMEGLIREGDEIITAAGDPAAKDAALIAAAQRVEHYEIAAYGTARTLADELGFEDAKDLLDQTLDEESNADSLLTKIATGGLLKSGINEKAAR
jgi:ferritin-like metal-binding protein YciE